MPKQVLTSVNKDKILRIIDGWSGKLTWDKLCAKVVEMTDLDSVHRNTLDGNPEIYDAWKNKKAELAKQKAELAKLKDDAKDPSPTIESLLEENKELESRNTRLERKLNLYKQKLVRWQYNMQNMPGVDFEKIEPELDYPLPKVERK